MQEESHHITVNRKQTRREREKKTDYYKTGASNVAASWCPYTEKL